MKYHSVVLEQKVENSILADSLVNDIDEANIMERDILQLNEGFQS